MARVAGNAGQVARAKLFTRSAGILAGFRLRTDSGAPSEIELDDWQFTIGDSRPGTRPSGRRRCLRLLLAWFVFLTVVTLMAGRKTFRFPEAWPSGG